MYIDVACTYVLTMFYAQFLFLIIDRPAWLSRSTFVAVKNIELDAASPVSLIINAEES